METITRRLTLDRYDPALELADDNAFLLRYEVENNDVLARFRGARRERLPKGSLGGVGSYGPELLIHPEKNVVPNCSGVTFRSAVPGAAARVSAFLFAAHDPQPGAGSPVPSGGLDASNKIVVPAWTPIAGTSFFPSSLETYDVSGFANLTGFIGLDPGAVGNGELTLTWYADPDATQITGVQGFPMSSLIPSTAQLMIPNLGPYLRLKFQHFSGVTNLGCRLFGTNRTSPLPLIPGDSMQITYAARPIGAGVVETTYPADYFAGPVQVNFQPSAANMVLTFYAFDLTLVTYPTDQFTGPFRGQTIVPFGAWLVTVQNPGAAGTYTLVVTQDNTGN